MTQTELVEWGLNPKYITPQFLESIGCTATFPSRFIKQVQKASDRVECWIWTGCGKRYGTIGKGVAGAGMMGAHCASWILHYGGPIPKGYMVCHTCDVPECVNPSHLWIGTQKDNMADAARKGRVKNLCYGGKRKGQDSPASTLKNNQVNRIISLLKEGKLSQQKIADKFGVTQSAITFIKCGRSWNHLTGIKKT